jgi:hypothetical protein
MGQVPTGKYFSWYICLDIFKTLILSGWWQMVTEVSRLTFKNWNQGSRFTGSYIRYFASQAYSCFQTFFYLLHVQAFLFQRLWHFFTWRHLIIKPDSRLCSSLFADHWTKTWRISQSTMDLVCEKHNILTITSNLVNLNTTNWEVIMMNIGYMISQACYFLLKIWICNCFSFLYIL